jgi:GntR family transcriptional regulator/MocR family aminotransferase
MADHLIALTSKIVTLDHDSPVPLFRQLYYCLRDGIITGQLRPGSQLPSTRLLALDLGLSRVTVQSAYEQLTAAGHAEGRHGSGTYVAMRPPPSLPQGESGPLSAAAPQPTARALSRRVSSLMAAPAPLHAVHTTGALLAFAPDLAALDAFPWQLWGRLLGRRWRQSAPELLQPQHDGGYRPLREALVQYLTRERGLACNADQVLIVAGAQQAIDLAARVLLDPSDKAWIEDPGYPGAYGALAVAGAQVCPVPVDGEGVNVAAGILHAPEARLAFVTPAHQCPTGVTMSLKRRLALLEWAYRAGAWILEDDCGGEYCYNGRPVAPLHALDRERRVLYVGSFGKLLFPALRLGYLVAPADLVKPLLQMLRFTTQHPPLLEQTVLAEFIAGGHFAHHLRTTRALYQERQQVLLEQLALHVHEVKAEAVETGSTLLAWLPTGIADQAVASRAAQHGVLAQPLTPYRFTPGGQGALVLGFAAPDHDAIRRGVQQLALALRN